MSSAKRLLLLPALCLALIVSACGTSMKKPELKQNPNPKQRYDITMTIQDAPGSFDSITGYAYYKIENDVCVALQPGSGARLTPDITVPFVLTRTGDVYTGQLYADKMIDEDYYGLGVCKWKLMISYIRLRARTNMFDALFYGSANAIKSMPATPMTLYFFNAIYTDDKVSNYTDYGGARDSGHKQFSVTISSKENFQ
jgi:hypothetical protein